MKATIPSRGTVVRDCSWRLVKVCKRVRANPRTTAATRTGAVRMIASFISWRSSSATRSGVKCVPLKALQQRVSEQIPTIDHDEQQDLQGRRNNHWRQLKHSDGG